MLRSRKQQEMRKIRRAQNAIKITFCLVLLLCTVGMMKLMTTAAKGIYKQTGGNKVQTADVVPDEPKQEEPVKAVKEEKQDDEQKKEDEKEPANKKKDGWMKVCLDAGHGGTDGGCLGDNRKESDDVLRIILLIQKELQAQGVEVVMTRDTDVFIELEQRVKIANEQGANYFVSIHRNKGDGYGVETWISKGADEQGKSLGQNIHNKIIETGVQRDRGVKEGSQDGRGDYYVLRCTNMPASLVEMGFINNDVDNADFDSKIEQYAKAIADGIVQTGETYIEGASQQ